MKRSFWSTIRGKLVSRTLLVVMVPLLIVGGVAVAAFAQLSRSADESVTDARTVLGDEVVGARAAGIADEVSREIAIFVNERLNDATGWASEREIVTAAAGAGDRAQREGLTELSTDELEELYADDRQMGSPAEEDLQDNLSASPDFKEVFFTNEYGYNVAVSNQTSDFVQSDEDWWQLAWEHGVHIDEPEFDDSAGVFSVDMSIRIDQGSTPVGVMKSSLDIALVQAIATRFATGDEGYEVSILERLGRFLANTENDHTAAGIMNGAVTASTSRNPRLIDAHEGNLENYPNGYSIDDEFIAGYSHISEQLAGIRPDTDMAGFQEAFDWIVVIEQPTEVGFAALSSLEQLNSDLSDTSALMTVLLIGVAVAAVVVAVVSSIVFSRRITGPIQKLRDAAVHAADEALPSVVAQIDTIGPDDEIPPIAPVEISTGDEVEDLAHSFNTVQQTAADLAAQQARLRRQNVASTFVSLGRRNQNLLSKQLEHINAMEQNESDSVVLRRLFQLDHLATRMRRNAESLLVLAGEETPRRFRAPVSVQQLFQAAGAEIEEYSRIEMGNIDEAAVEGGAASDIAHLLAELLENASRFSPPTSRIHVSGHRRAEGGYVLSITDAGLGMEEQDLKTANMRLADPVEFDRAPSAYLGLFVVGHLARRHALTVRLAAGTIGGITATVVVPEKLLVAPAAPERPVMPTHEATSAPPVDPPASAPEPIAVESVALVESVEAIPEPAPAHGSPFNREPGPGPADEDHDADDGYHPEPVPDSLYEEDLGTVRAVSSDELADPWADVPDASASSDELADPWADVLDASDASASSDGLADPWADVPARSDASASSDGLADPWADVPARSDASGELADPWADVPARSDASGSSGSSGELADPWADGPAAADSTDPASVDVPGLPLTTAMPIAIPPIDSRRGVEEPPSDGPPPRWGRDGGKRSLFGGMPLDDESDPDDSADMTEDPVVPEILAPEHDAGPLPPPPPTPTTPVTAPPSSTTAPVTAPPPPRSADTAPFPPTAPRTEPAATTAPAAAPPTAPPAMPPISPLTAPPAVSSPELPPPAPKPVAQPVNHDGFDTLASYAEAMAEAASPPATPVSDGQAPPAAPQPPPPPPGPPTHAATVVEAIEATPTDHAGATIDGYTPSGFRKRRRGEEGAPDAASTSSAEKSDVPRRDPGEVKASLARFRAGVTQGRAQVDHATTDDHVGDDDRSSP